MASRAQSLPNHYEVLGLSPGAGQDEITCAFAKAMSMFGARPVAVAAHISQAFEVLRNPEKRRAYDRSIGLVPKPEPYQWQFAIAPQLRAPFIASAMTGGAVRGARPGFVPEPQVTAEPAPEAPTDAQVAEAKLSSLIASLRELAEPSAPVPASEAFPPEQAQAQKQEGALELPVDGTPGTQMREEPRRVGGDPFTPVIDHILAVGHAEKARLYQHGNQRRDWKRPGLALGGLLAGAGIIGTIVGLSAGGSTSPQRALTVPLPAATSHAGAVPSVPAEAPSSMASDAAAAEALPVPPAPPMPMHRQAIPSKAPVFVPQQQSAQVPVEEEANVDAVVATPSDPLAPNSTAAQPVATRMPLPNAVIARTIEHIGYACGSVASTAAVEGASGVFNVTCTSGNSYRAAPVGGRYHFRKIPSP